MKYEEIESTYTNNKAMNSQTRDLFFFHAGFLFCQAKAREVSSKAKKGDWRLIGAMLKTKHQFIHELIFQGDSLGNFTIEIDHSELILVLYE